MELMDEEERPNSQTVRPYVQRCFHQIRTKNGWQAAMVVVSDATSGGRALMFAELFVCH